MSVQVNGWLKTLHEILDMFLITRKVWNWLVWFLKTLVVPTLRRLHRCLLRITAVHHGRKLCCKSTIQKYKTMCLPHGIVDKDNGLHTPSWSLGTTDYSHLEYHLESMSVYQEPVLQIQHILYTLKNKRIRLYSKSTLSYALIFDLRLFLKAISHAPIWSLCSIGKNVAALNRRCYKYSLTHETMQSVSAFDWDYTMLSAQL